MTDLEMVRLCAQAMDLGCYEVSDNKPEHTIRLNGSSSPHNNYWPLTDDAQAMALVKRFNVKLTKTPRFDTWRAVTYHESGPIKGDVLGIATNKDLNRAIVECVAHLSADEAGEGR